MKKLLSIVVPAYNMERYLNKCLSSLIIPSIDLLDIIVVNDGSSDDTSFIAHSYSTKFPNSFRVIDKDNGNYGSCVNEGIKFAIGKYIKILDADDSFNTGELEKFVKTTSELDCDLIISDYDIVNEDDDITYHFSLDTLSNAEYGFNEIEDALCISCFQMHAVTYKTGNIRNQGYRQLEGISYTDQQWMFLPMSEVKTVYYFNSVVYRYLIGREGQTISSDAYVRNANSVKLITEQMCNDYLYLKSDSEYLLHNRYLSYRLAQQLPRLYYVYLIKKNDSQSLHELKQFDVFLRQTLPSHYSLLNDTKLLNLPFKYIKYWRKNGYYDRFLLLTIIKKIIKLYKSI